MIAIRAAAADDAEAAIDVVRRSITELCVGDHRNDPATLSRWLANKTPESFRGWLANPGNSCLVATSGGHVCGVGLLRPDGEIVLFFLRPGLQRQGIGTSIYRALEEKAIARGMKRLHLGSTLMARSFYESMGFRPCGPVQMLYDLLPAHPYEKTLN